MRCHWACWRRAVSHPPRWQDPTGKRGTCVCRSRHRLYLPQGVSLYMYLPLQANLNALPLKKLPVVSKAPVYASLLISCNHAGPEHCLSVGVHVVLPSLPPYPASWYEASEHLNLQRRKSETLWLWACPGTECRYDYGHFYQGTMTTCVWKEKCIRAVGHCFPFMEVELHVCSIKYIAAGPGCVSSDCVRVYAFIVHGCRLIHWISQTKVASACYIVLMVEKVYQSI